MTHYDNLLILFPLPQISGYWYEVARIPNVEVLECLNVSVPAAIENNTLSLGLNYISTVNGGWQATRQTVDFPWDNSTQHGIFSLDYDRVTVTYKLVYTNNFTLAFVCGYSNFSPIPLFKLFTRQRQINEEMINFIKLLADKYGIAEQIAWEEQSPDKCNGSRGQDPLTILIGCIVLVWGLSVRKSVCI
ncbi:hypothetical protein KR009_005846 [Drosophila setifemur]|nr:hypothetical protein KR009_005846 [Drosophila setifemur]